MKTRKDLSACVLCSCLQFSCLHFSAPIFLTDSFGFRVSAFFRTSDFGLRTFCRLRPAALAACLLLSSLTLQAAEPSWPAALAEMPLGAGVSQLTWSNSIDLLLPALRSNQVVKAMIFLPGATDEFYLARRAKADLTNFSPTLLDAVRALTNQTAIRATFRPPLLLLHTDRDQLEPEIFIQYQPAADKLKQTRFRPHLVCIDRDWDYLAPLLWKALKLDICPWRVLARFLALLPPLLCRMGLGRLGRVGGRLPGHQDQGHHHSQTGSLPTGRTLGIVARSIPASPALWQPVTHGGARPLLVLR